MASLLDKINDTLHPEDQGTDLLAVATFADSMTGLPWGDFNDAELFELYLLGFEPPVNPDRDDHPADDCCWGQDR